MDQSRVSPRKKTLKTHGFPTLDFLPPVITSRSTAFWGSVTVIVPPNVAVEQDGSAILGGFGDAGGEQPVVPVGWCPHVGWCPSSRSV